MSGGGGGGDQTTRTEPWSGQQPFLRDIFGQAQQLYRQPPQYFPGSTVVPFSPFTEQALQMNTQRAMGGPQEAALQNYLTGTLNQSAIDPFSGALGSNFLMGGIPAGQSGLVGQMGPIDPRQQIGQIGSTLDPNAAGQLSATAGGEFLGSNPYLDQAYDQAAERMGEAFREEAMPALAAQFGSAGRTGSALHGDLALDATREFRRGLGDLATDIYGGAYDAERNRQITAASQLGNLDLGTAGLGADVYGSGNQRALQAAQQLQAGGLGGINALNNLYGTQQESMMRAAALTPQSVALDYQNIDRLMQSGQITEEQAANYLQDMIDRFNFSEQQPWQQLQNYSNIVQAGQWGGDVTREAPQTSRVTGALGGAMTGAALGSFIPGIGTGIGAAAGGILGAFI